MKDHCIYKRVVTQVQLACTPPCARRRAAVPCLLPAAHASWVSAYYSLLDLMLHLVVENVVFVSAVLRCTQPAYGATPLGCSRSRREQIL